MCPYFFHPLSQHKCFRSLQEKKRERGTLCRVFLLLQYRNDICHFAHDPLASNNSDDQKSLFFLITWKKILIPPTWRFHPIIAFISEVQNLWWCVEIATSSQMWIYQVIAHHTPHIQGWNKDEITVMNASILKGEKVKKLHGRWSIAISESHWGPLLFFDQGMR